VNRLTAFSKNCDCANFDCFLAGMLLISTACSGATTQGANPDNPAVQAGGANNPKSGGDSYTNLKNDPKVNTTAPKSK